jgi:hypothetical protein
MPTIAVPHIAALLKEMDKLAKIALDPVVEKKYSKLTAQINTEVQDLVENVTEVDEYKTLAARVIKHVKEVLAAQELAKKNAGPTLKIKGNDEATEAEAITFIKKHLPSNGYGNINQALNDVVLGRGKATTGLSGVLHASSGKPDKAGGCTLFFKRSGDVSEIVGIGQHIAVSSGQKPKYYINYTDVSALKKDKEFQL